MKKIMVAIGLVFISAFTLSASPAASNTYMSTQIRQVNAVADATPVVKAYLMLKDALVAGKSTEAAEAGNALATALNSWESQVDKKVFAKDGKAALKSAVAIGKAKDITAQRINFKDLSTSLYALLKSSGITTKLYWDYCPMAKANWLSDKKEIANPYYGTSMLTCGSVKETLEP